MKANHVVPKWLAVTTVGLMFIITVSAFWSLAQAAPSSNPQASVGRNQLADTTAPLGGKAAPLATNTPTVAPTDTPPPACGLYWRYIASPNLGSYDITYGVTAITTNDVWAVGFYVSGTIHTLTEHWDGSIWSVVPSPNPGSSFNFLSTAAASATNDVWAVGYSTTGGIEHTLILNWNGSSWSVVPSPNMGAGSNQLNGVTVVAANDVWAVGAYNTGSANLTLTEHWDGSIWSIVPSPNPNANNNLLYAVTKVATNDVWAVGSAGSQTLTEHWNGSAWSVVSSPNVGAASNLLRSVTVVTANNVWAVGSYTNVTNGPLQPLVEHWNGSVWSVVPIPNGGPGDTDLRGVAAITASDIWTIGYTGATVAAWVPFSEHWDGSVWSIVPIPNGPSPHNSTLWGIAAIATNDIWTVGDDSMTEIEHYSDPCSTATSTPTFSPTTTPMPTNTATSTLTNTPVPPTSTPTNTPIPPTNTPTSTPMPPTNTPAPPTQTPGGATATPTLSSTPMPPTNTPTNTPMPPTNTPAPPTQTPSGATATPMPTSTIVPLTTTPTDCANPFVDISGNVFYIAIHYLNCRGVVNGTDATHYSPAGTSTRGQFAKVVVLGFGTPLYTPNTQDFVDVPPSYFAYVFIESGFHSGILSGFDQTTCTAHGLGFPCYLPNLPITRGQLTKLVVNAGGYTLITPAGGQQDFVDVPPTNVFYVSIETAYTNHIVNGYPGHLFLPNNNIRRDEMAQIVYTGILNRPH